MTAKDTKPQAAASGIRRIFSGLLLTAKSTRSHTGHLGVENQFYYHPQLKRWVERGKEDACSSTSELPPPPTTAALPMSNNGLGGAAPPKRRSVSQRYKLQDNLRVSTASPADNATAMFGRTSADGLLVDGKPFLPMPPPLPPGCSLGLDAVVSGSILPPLPYHHSAANHHHHDLLHPDVTLVLNSGPPSACSDCCSVDGSSSGSNPGSGPPSTRSNSVLSLAADVRAALTAVSASSVGSSRGSSACGSGGGSGARSPDESASSSPSSAFGASPRRLVDDHDGDCIHELLAASSSPFVAARTESEPSALPQTPPFLQPQWQQPQLLEQSELASASMVERAGSVSILCTVDSAFLTAPAYNEVQQRDAEAAGAGGDGALFDIFLGGDDTISSGAAAAGGVASGTSGGGSVLSRSSSLALSFADFVTHRDSLNDPDVLFREVQQQQLAADGQQQLRRHPPPSPLQHQSAGSGCGAAAAADEAFSFSPALAACGVARESVCEGEGGEGDGDADVCGWERQSCWSLSTRSSGFPACPAPRRHSEPQPNALPEPLPAAANGLCVDQLREHQQQQAAGWAAGAATAATAAPAAHGVGASSPLHSDNDASAAAEGALSASSASSRSSFSSPPMSLASSSSSSSPTAAAASSSAAAHPAASSGGGVDLTAVDSAVQLLKALRGSLLKAPPSPASCSAATVNGVGIAQQPASPAAPPLASAGAIGASLAQAAQSLAGLGLLPPSVSNCAGPAVASARNALPPPVTFAAAPCSVSTGARAALAGPVAAASVASSAGALTAPPVAVGPPSLASQSSPPSKRRDCSSKVAVLRRMRADWALVQQQLGGVLGDYAALAKQAATTVAAQGALEQRGAAARRRGAALQLEREREERGVLVAQLQSEREQRWALERELEAERAERAELEARLAERERVLMAEATEARAEAEGARTEMDELLLCLGQESTKVAALTEALRAAGGEPEGIVEAVESEFAARGVKAEADAA